MYLFRTFWWLGLRRGLAWWRRGFLSKGRKLTLSKSTLSNLLLYYLFLFPSLFVAKKLVAIHCHFSAGIWRSKCGFILLPGTQLIFPFRRMVLDPWLRSTWLSLVNGYEDFMLKQESFWWRVIKTKFKMESWEFRLRPFWLLHGAGAWEFINSAWKDYNGALVGRFGWDRVSFCWLIEV